MPYGQTTIFLLDLLALAHEVFISYIFGIKV